MNEEAIRLVKEIEARNAERFGEIQPCCRLYKDFCRCEPGDEPSRPADSTE